MADIDSQLELKKRARRRLVGAAALALLAAIVLPMVMDSEPRDAGPEIQIRIPSQEGSNFAARPMQPATTPPAKETPPKAASPEDLPETSTAPSPVSAQSASPRTAAETKPEPKPHVAETKTEAKPAPQEAKPVDDGKRAATLLGEAPVTSASAPVPKGFLIQLGVFKDSANAQSVVADAKSAGVGARTETAGALTRVRAGPYANREAADAAAARLRRAGLTAVVQPAS